MKPSHLLFLPLCAFLLASCGTARYFAGFKPEEAKGNMALVGPASCIYYLDKDNRESYDDSLSLVSQTMITNLVDELGIPVSGQFQLDSVQKEEAVAFMRYLVTYNPKQLGFLPIPELLDEVLETGGARYGLLVYAEGMTRDGKGLLKEVAKDVLLGTMATVLSGGAVVASGSAAIYASNLYAAVLDAQTNRIVFYNQSPQEGHPLKPNQVRKQLSSLLKDFLK